MMATINVSRNYPRYHSRTSTGGSLAKSGSFSTSMVTIRNNLCAHFGGGIMVWGGITAHGKMDLVIVDGNLNSRRYIDEILRPVVVPYTQNMGQGAFFQDHNARPHRARIVDAYLQQEQITRVDWPACSPDLNPN